jgi:hypothetical protein
MSTNIIKPIHTKQSNANSADFPVYLVRNPNYIINTANNEFVKVKDLETLGGNHIPHHSGKKQFGRKLS